MYDKQIMEEFLQKMRDRLEMGAKNYLDDYCVKSQFRSMEEELFDVANYALLEYMRVKELQLKAKPVEIDVLDSKGNKIPAKVTIGQAKVTIQLEEI